jgi:hypothetical protein
MQSPVTFSCPVIDNFIWIEPPLRGHLSYKATYSLSQGWPLNTGLTVYCVQLHGLVDKYLIVNRYLLPC